MSENKSDPAGRPSGSGEDAGRRDVEEYLASQAWETRLAEARARREKVLAARQAAGGEQAARPSVRPLPIPAGDAHRATMLVPPRQAEDPGTPDIPADTAMPPHTPLRRRAALAAALCGGAVLAILGWFVLPDGDPNGPASFSGRADDPGAGRTAGGSEGEPTEPAGARDPADTAMSVPGGPAPDRTGAPASGDPIDTAKRPAPDVQDRPGGLAPAGPLSADPSLPRFGPDLAASLPGAADPSGDAGALAPFSAASNAPPGPVPGGSSLSNRAAQDLGFDPGTPPAVPSAGFAGEVAFGSPSGTGVPALASLPERLPGPGGDAGRTAPGRDPTRPGATLTLDGPVSSDVPADAFRTPSDGPAPQDGALPERTAAPGGTAAPSALVPAAIPDSASYALRIHAASDRSASALQDRLIGAGFTMIDVNVAPFQWPETTIFYFHDEDARAARGIADLLGGAAMSASGITPSPPAGRIDVHLGG